MTTPAPLPMQKGDQVTYLTGVTKHRIRARVLRVHRDGTVTVKAQFVLDKAGNDTGGFVGYTYRFDNSLVERVS